MLCMPFEPVFVTCWANRPLFCFQIFFALRIGVIVCILQFETGSKCWFNDLVGGGGGERFFYE